MKQYVVDELRYQDYEKINAYLDETYGPVSVSGVYWIPVDPELLTAEQKAHTECRPFYMAVELAEKQLSCEFLVRTRNRVRCSCMGYATERQRNWIIGIVDDMLDQLGISI